MYGIPQNQLGYLHPRFDILTNWFSVVGNFFLTGLYFTVGMYVPFVVRDGMHRFVPVQLRGVKIFHLEVAWVLDLYFSFLTLPEYVFRVRIQQIFNIPYSMSLKISYH